MRITDLTEDLAQDLYVAWEKALELQPDYARSWEYFAHLLLESDSQWYQLDGFKSWIYITGIGDTEATLHALNLEGAKALPAARQELKLIMSDFNLHRLTAVLPGPPTKLHRAIKFLGFHKEGRMREALVYDGRPADAVIYGILRREVEHDDAAPPLRPRRRRRRRSRRKENKWEHKVQSESTPQLPKPSNRPESKAFRSTPTETSAAKSAPAKDYPGVAAGHNGEAVAEGLTSPDFNPLNLQVVLPG